MIIQQNGENKKIIFGEKKNFFMLKCGEIQIVYISDKHIYVISRIDGKPIDGTENVGGEYYGNMKKPNSLNEILEYVVNALTILQIEPEINLFNEFDYTYNSDKTEIIIYPVFIEKNTNIEIAFENKMNSNMCLSFGAKKVLRKKI